MFCFLQIKYKKGYDQQKLKFTSLADPPDMELAKRVFTQRSDVSLNDPQHLQHSLDTKRRDGKMEHILIMMICM